MTKIKFALTLFLAIIFCGDFAYSLSLYEYIEQVKSKNLNYEAANLNSDAYELLQEKAKLVNAITLYGYTEKGFTEQNAALQIFRYSKTYNEKHQVGFSHSSSFGLDTNLFYSLNKITYKNLVTSSPNAELARQNYQSTPTLELSFALWQNRFGARNRALRDSTYFRNQSDKFNARSLSLSELVNSEKAYWNMVYAKKSILIQKQAVTNAQQIYDYVHKRERMNLGEKGDVLQAKALLESRKLLLKQAENDEKIAARNFNKQRFVNSDEVAEELEDFEFSLLEKFITPKVRDKDRLDVKASEAGMKSAVADAKLEEENNKPSLNLYGSYSVNQIERNGPRALDNSLNQVGESGKIGINFSMPINFGLTSDIRRGALKSASAARIDYRWKVFQQENDWLNLVTNIDSFKENLKLAREIEKSQNLKLNNEKVMLKQGRTNTYQVLLFEQDFAASKLDTIQIARDLSYLISDLKLYQNQPYEN